MDALPIFSAYGIELEYMLVDRDTLNILPQSDKVLREIAGEYVNEVERGEIAWSNEVVLHVIELKTNGPVANFETLPSRFMENITAINTILDDYNGVLMPGAMHPWMNPSLETRLWPHGQSEIYDTYNRIFNCEGHGWSNLQSMHINLPFLDDREFALLHTAIRLLLPLLPGIAASSPVMNGELTGLMDTRMETYRKNARIIPSITGLVIPEPVVSQREYQQHILEPMYKDIAKDDPHGILQDEWLNSRGAIARFDRNTIEIRVLDTQETPLTDLAIAELIKTVLKKITSQEWSMLDIQLEISTEALSDMFLKMIHTAEKTVIDNQDYLSLFNFPDKRSDARDLWIYLFESSGLEDITERPDLESALQYIFKNGTLASRIAAPLQKRMTRPRLNEVYRVLTECLAEGTLFEGI